MLRMACVLLLIVPKAHYGGPVTPQMSILQMIESYGYPAERYRRVRTEDGYLLTVVRIPHGMQNKKRNNRPVVFLMHGLLSSAFDWVNMGPGFSIAYDLAEAGYDVWMGNARGNKLSRLHSRLNPTLNNKRFWSFSWHEIGIYDLPAMIDFALSKTGQKKLSYIGHSQGTTSFFVLTSMKPEYNKKIKLMVALAPVAYMTHMWSPFLRLLSVGHKPLHTAMNLFGWYEFIPGVPLMNLIGKKVCNSVAVVSTMCASAFFMICGWDSEQFNKSTLPIILANVPAGAASRQFLHYAQGIRSGKFQAYDLGMTENLKKYKLLTPPEYNLTNIRTPISLVYSDNDWLAATKDVHRLKGDLSNVVDMYRVPFARFNHLDYLFAIDTKKFVNDHVVEILLEWN